MAIEDTIGNIFDFLQETNLTEEDFYNNAGEYPVFSGQTENNGIVGYLNTFNQNLPCVTFTTYGSAGKLFFREGKYSIGRNCMGLRPKELYFNEINLRWFAYAFQNLFYRLRIGDPKGQKSLNQLLLKRIKIKIPDLDIQERQLILYENLFKLKKSINLKISEIFNTLKLKNKYNDSEIEAIDELKIFFDILGGNSGLTEEFIYYNLPESEKDTVLILTSSTLERTSMGFISEHARPNNKKLKIFNAPAILIARNGYAGTMNYIDNGRFTTNDHAYVLKPKAIWKNRINLEWFILEYQELFYKIITSKSDNATFSKDYAERQLIKIPKIDKQLTIVKKLYLYNKLLKKLKSTNSRIDEILEHTIK